MLQVIKISLTTRLVVAVSFFGRVCLCFNVWINLKSLVLFSELSDDILQSYILGMLWTYLFLIIST